MKNKFRISVLGLELILVAELVQRLPDLLLRQMHQFLNILIRHPGTAVGEPFARPVLRQLDDIVTYIEMHA